MKALFITLLLTITSLAQSISTDKATFAPGEMLPFNWKKTATDQNTWVGIYQKGQVPTTTTQAIIKKQLRKKDAKSGIIRFHDGLKPGEYVAYLYKDNPWKVLAGPTHLKISSLAPRASTVNQTTSTNKATSDHSISTDESTFAPGEILSFNWKKTVNEQRAWVGIYKKGQVPTKTTKPHTKGQLRNRLIKSGIYRFNEGLEPGEYVAYLYDDSPWKILAGPTHFAVIAPTPKIISPWKLPKFTTRPAVPGKLYKNNLTFYADPQSFQGEYVFTKTKGPDWLKVSPTGQATGTPTTEDLGINNFTVQISDSKGDTHESQITLKVTDQP